MPISFNKNYEVSNLGNVRSLDRIVPYMQRNQFCKTASVKHLKGKVLAPRYTKTGYARVQISNIDYYIGRLVCHEFLGLDLNDDSVQVTWMDGDLSNNALSNLKLTTEQDNFGIPIIINDTFYPTLTDASKSTGISKSHLATCVRSGKTELPRLGVTIQAP